MRHGTCRGCGQKNWLEKHHVYPQSKFKGKGEIIYLCPNCHTGYHQKLGEMKSNDPSFYYSFYMSWLWKAFVILIILGLTKTLF